jgi:hypothetical protein
MIRILFGVFLVLHGLIHLLYFGQNARFFELRPGMVWPDGSWAFSRLLGDGTTRMLASVFLILAAFAFVAGGAGVLLRQPWWRSAAVGAAVFSTVIYLLFWDGAWRNLADKGLIAILINAAILAALLVLQWPDFEF